MLDYQLVCYQNPWIIKEVYKYSSLVSSAVTNTAIVEHRVIQSVGKYLSENIERLHNKRYIMRMIQRETYAALGRNRREHAVHFADISYEDDSGELIEYDPVDVLANVESEAIGIKETVALLAKNDGRRKLILNAWTNGFTNDKALSETLAGFLGGQAETHRKFIKRFRIECRGILTAAI